MSTWVLYDRKAQLENSAVSSAGPTVSKISASASEDLALNETDDTVCYTNVGDHTDASMTSDVLRG